MTQQHPITPPPELVEQWMQVHTTKYDLARQAAQWGADQELEACCEWFQSFYKLESWMPRDLERLRVARRPKPLSLKEQALQALAEADLGSTEAEWSQRFDTIRRALEALPND
jgi:hypothetical protein